jgi:hypothetical protein
MTIGPYELGFFKEYRPVLHKEFADFSIEDWQKKFANNDRYYSDFTPTEYLREAAIWLYENRGYEWVCQNLTYASIHNFGRTIESTQLGDKARQQKWLVDQKKARELQEAIADLNVMREKVISLGGQDPQVELARSEVKLARRDNEGEIATLRGIIRRKNNEIALQRRHFEEQKQATDQMARMQRLINSERVQRERAGYVLFTAWAGVLAGLFIELFYWRYISKEPWVEQIVNEMLIHALLLGVLGGAIGGIAYAVISEKTRKELRNNLDFWGLVHRGR